MGKPRKRAGQERSPQIGRLGAAAPSRAFRAAALKSARLYFVTPDREPDVVFELASAAIRGGADVVQLRHKTFPRGRLLDLARRLRTLAVEAGRLFVVNDHVDIALIADADGVHLGPGDVTVGLARTLAGDRLLVGASASSVDAGLQAVAEGADYLGSGPAFATPVKAEKSVIGPAGIAAIANAVRVPVFAIGGIDATNVGQLIAVGLRRVCVIRAVADAPDPESATRRLRAMLDT